MTYNEGGDSALCERVRTVRRQLFGECGGPMLAGLLGIPQRRLARIEAGEPIPAEIILKLIDVTGVSPRWLLSGAGEAYAVPSPDRFKGREPGTRLG